MTEKRPLMRYSCQSAPAVLPVRGTTRGENLLFPEKFYDIFPKIFLTFYRIVYLCLRNGK